MPLCTKVSVVKVNRKYGVVFVVVFDARACSFPLVSLVSALLVSALVFQLQPHRGELP